MTIDLIFPEYHVTLAGELIKGGLFGRASTDYIFGYLWSLVGIKGLMLWIMTYPITFVLLGGGSAILLRNFVKQI